MEKMIVDKGSKKGEKEERKMTRMFKYIQIYLKLSQ